MLYVRLFQHCHGQVFYSFVRKPVIIGRSAWLSHIVKVPAAIVDFQNGRVKSSDSTVLTLEIERDDEPCSVRRLVRFRVREHAFDFG